MPVVTTGTKHFPVNNRPYTVTCTVTFVVAVPLEMVAIQWTNLDGILLTQIRQINKSIFARDAIFDPLRVEDNGTYVCGAGVSEGRFPISRHAYDSAHISVLSKHYNNNYVLPSVH